jgi:hypothetical protein
MKLFNIKDQLKMYVPDRYELALFKLYCLLIFHAGYVKLRGDRYLYNGQPIVQFGEAGEFMVIELLAPVFPDNLLLPAEKNDPSKVQATGRTIDAFDFKIGENCQEEYKAILNHLKYTNNEHIFRDKCKSSLSRKLLI